LTRACKRLRRSSRWAEPIDVVGLLGFVCCLPFASMPCGADLNATGIFLPFPCVSLPPGHAASASLACGPMQTSAACAELATPTPATTPKAAVATRSARSIPTFDSFITVRPFTLEKRVLLRTGPSDSGFAAYLPHFDTTTCR
jgi:hypothetical protein